MISYIDTIDGIAAEHLQGFFGYMLDLICDTNVQPFYARLGMQPYTGMILRNYDRQSGAQ